MNSEMAYSNWFIQLRIYPRTKYEIIRGGAGVAQLVSARLSEQEVPG